MLVALSAQGLAVASTVGVLLLLAAVAVVVLRVSRAKRVKLGLTSVEIEGSGAASQEGVASGGTDNSVRVDVRRNRFKGDVGDISGIKSSGEDASASERSSG